MTEVMYQKLTQALIDGEPEDAEALAKEALVQGLDLLVTVLQGGESAGTGHQQVGIDAEHHQEGRVPKSLQKRRHLP